MRKSVKVVLIIASSLVGMGILCMCLSFMLGGVDLFFRPGEKNDVKVISATFDEVDIVNIKDVSNNVRIIKSEDDKVKVTYGVSEKFSYYVKEIDGTLYVEFDDLRHWQDYIFFGGFKDADLILELPEKTLNELNVKCTSGDIEALSINSLITTLRTTSGDVEVGGSVGVLYASATSGDVKVNSDISAESVQLSTTSGKLTLGGNIKGAADIDNTSGGIIVSDLKCSDIKLNTTSGKIKGRNISAVSLKADTISGGVSLTDVICTGDMTLEATSGNIELNGVDAQNYDINTTSGSIDAEILAPKFYNIKSKDGAYPANNGTEQGMFNAKTTSGSIDVEVAE